jgi:quinol-cytochrome oxidoreductase complex cytochrome b subunit
MKNLLQNLWEKVTNSRPWKSFFRHGWPDNPLDRSLIMTTNIFFHLHPVRVNKKSIRAAYSLGLGVITTVMFIILAITGILLMFYYVPSTELAYFDIVKLQTKVPFGQLLRNMHRWGAHMMVLSAVLHMVRVFYTGAYKPPREFNWVVGVVLLILTLAGSFTGYLLPWDQLAFWAITVGTSVAAYEPLMGKTIKKILLGGPEVGQAALTRFYGLHVMVVPGILFLVIALHIWRVRKDGGLAANEVKDDEEMEAEDGSN